MLQLDNIKERKQLIKVFAFFLCYPPGICFYFFISNLQRKTLHIRTQVGGEKYDIVSYDVSYNLMKQFGDDEITIHELINTVLEPWEQVNQAQASYCKLLLL